MIKPNMKVPFIAKHKPVLYGAFFLAIASIVLAFIIGPNWGTSFQGGTSITIHFDNTVSTETVRTEFEIDPRFEIPTVQQIGNESDNRFVVRTRTTTTLNCAKLESVKTNLVAEVANASGDTRTIGQWPSCDPTKEDGIRGDFFISIIPQEGKVAPEEPMTDADVQSLMAKSGLEAIVSFDPGAHRYLVKPTGIQSEVQDLLKTKFAAGFDLSKYPGATDEAKLEAAVANSIDQIDTVGADVGEKFRSDALVSVFAALLLMLLYIGVRFDARYAPAAVISLTVTTILTFGIVIVLKMEITLETVAAFLSLVGYGINDTIVTFDRVRENVTLATPEESLSDIVNRAINECLSRTCITSLTTLIAIIPMACLSTGATRDFAIIMTIGIIIATFNSIFISCPMFLKFDKMFRDANERNKMRREIEDLKENI